jgi:serine/threonine protein kinase
MLSSVLPPHAVGRLLHPLDSCPSSSGDDALGNLIIRSGDVWPGRKGRAYVGLEVLGSGAFGTVVKAAEIQMVGSGDEHGEKVERLKLSGDEVVDRIVAVKVVRNHAAYSSQATCEVHIHNLLQKAAEVMHPLTKVLARIRSSKI